MNTILNRAGSNDFLGACHEPSRYMYVTPPNILHVHHLLPSPKCQDDYDLEYCLPENISQHHSQGFLDLVVGPSLQSSYTQQGTICLRRKVNYKINNHHVVHVFPNQVNRAANVYVYCYVITGVLQLITLSFSVHTHISRNRGWFT